MSSRSARRAAVEAKMKAALAKGEHLPGLVTDPMRPTKKAKSAANKEARQAGTYTPAPTGNQLSHYLKATMCMSTVPKAAAPEASIPPLTPLSAQQVPDPNHPMTIASCSTVPIAPPPAKQVSIEVPPQDKWSPVSSPEEDAATDSTMTAPAQTTEDQR